MQWDNWIYNHWNGFHLKHTSWVVMVHVYIHVQLHVGLRGHLHGVRVVGKVAVVLCVDVRDTCDGGFPR